MKTVKILTVFIFYREILQQLVFDIPIFGIDPDEQGKDL